VVTFAQGLGSPASLSRFGVERVQQLGDWYYLNRTTDNSGQFNIELGSPTGAFPIDRTLQLDIHEAAIIGLTSTPVTLTVLK
jgi:hypothetical protein